jgi:hypothetical protein
MNNKHADSFLFDSINNLVRLAMSCDDNAEAIRHMARALLLSSISQLTDSERSSLKLFLRTEVLKDVF